MFQYYCAKLHMSKLFEKAHIFTQIFHELKYNEKYLIIKQCKRFKITLCQHNSFCGRNFHSKRRQRMVIDLCFLFPQLKGSWKTWSDVPS